MSDRNERSAMNDETEVRRATEADLEEVVALWSHYIRAHRDNPAYRPAPDALAERKEFFRRHIRGEESAVFVIARKDGGLDGMLTCFVEDNLPYFRPPQYARLQTPYVRPDARKRGNLKRLLSAAFRWARELEMTELRMFTGADNVLANEIADELGFRAVEVMRRRPLDWSEPPEDQIDG